MINAAFHLHTMQVPPAEGKQTIPIRRLLSQLYSERVRLPVITNKNSVSDVKGAREVAARLGMFVPYATEARTRGDIEVIAVFDRMDSDIEKSIRTAGRYDCKEFIRYVKSEGGKTILPHPYLKRCGIAHLEGEAAVEELCRDGLVDGIEWNLQMDNVLMRRKNGKAWDLLDSVNKKYGLKIPLVFGNDSYFGDVGVLMQIKADNPEDALEKMFESGFSPLFVKRPMPLPYYLGKHLYTSLAYEPKGTLGLI